MDIRVDGSQAGQLRRTGVGWVSGFWVGVARPARCHICQDILRYEEWHCFCVPLVHAVAPNSTTTFVLWRLMDPKDITGAQPHSSAGGAGICGVCVGLLQGFRSCCQGG